MTIRIDEKGHRNQIRLPEGMPATNLEIIVNGNDNRLVVGDGCRWPARAVLEIRGNGCTLEIGAACALVGEFRLRDHETHLRIGEATTSMNLKISLHERGRIELGRDCMVSGDVRMDCSDMHSILDAATGERLNPPADIHIGDHVWIGQGVYVMKGVRIGEHSVIGAHAVVTEDVPAHSLVVGMPARVIRHGITWDRRRLPMGGQGTPSR